MAKRTVTATTYLKCEDCGNVVQIHRKRSKLKEKNHLKHMYCYKCKDKTGHIEEKEDVFLPEWIRERDRKEEEAEKAGDFK